MVTKTRQQRRAEAREGAKLLLQGKSLSFRLDYTLALIALAEARFLVLAPPETVLNVALMLAIMFGLLVYPALHIASALLQTRLKSAQKPIAFVFLAGLIGILSLWILRPAEIELRATSKVPVYGPGSNISGIPWQPEYSELDLTLRNASQHDYDNLDIEISTDLMFEDLRQQTGLASCAIARSGEPFETTSQKIIGGVPVGPADTAGADRKIVALDKLGQVISLSGKSNRTYRIRCDKFPASSQNNFVAALTAVNPFIGGRPPTNLYALPRPATRFSTKITLKTGILKRTRLISNCKMEQNCKS
jgi:hypothetical protein